MSSRKLLFAVLVLVALTVSTLFVPEGFYGEYAMAVVSVAAVYIGGNAATRWIQTRASKKVKPGKPAEPAVPPVE